MLTESFIKFDLFFFIVMGIVKIPEEQHEKLRKIKRKKGLMIKKQVELALEDYLDETLR